MRLPLAVLTVSCVLLFSAPRAGAQVVSVHYGAPNSGWDFLEPIGPFGVVGPTSYYSVYPNPTRGYVGITSYDFPYYGRAYGSPSDPWTWPYMVGSSGSAVLSRYYYPPLR